MMAPLALGDSWSKGAETYRRFAGGRLRRPELRRVTSLRRGREKGREGEHGDSEDNPIFSRSLRIIDFQPSVRGVNIAHIREGA